MRPSESVCERARRAPRAQRYGSRCTSSSEVDRLGRTSQESQNVELGRGTVGRLAKGSSESTLEFGCKRDGKSEMRVRESVGACGTVPGGTAPSTPLPLTSLGCSGASAAVEVTVLTWEL